MADYVDHLSDAELRTKLAEFGFPVVPITATTRKVMTKKLKLLIENKNKINNEGRRSLAKYSSEEESDDGEARVKKDKRRQTIAAVMQPPAVSKPRKSMRSSSKDEPAEVPQSSSVTKEVKSIRRTTRIIKPVLEADFETGSDSEPEVDSQIHSGTKSSSFTSEKKTSSTYTSYGLPTSSLSSPRGMLGQTSIESPKTGPSYDYSSPKPMSTTSYSRYTTATNNTHDSNDSLDKLNQIRSRLSLGSNYERPTVSSFTEKKVIGSSSLGDDDASVETPFLSNFTKRLSQLSSSAAPKVDYTYKNDIIKEHDTNGSSYNRLYLSRSKKRDYPQDFKSSNERNIFKNNFVPLALVVIACTFFIIISLMYMGIKTEQVPAIMDTSDYVLPLCIENDSFSKPLVNCVMQSEYPDALILLKVLLPELTKRAMIHYCSDTNFKPYMTDENIINHVTKNYAPKSAHSLQKDINNLEVLIFQNPKWGISIIHTENFPTVTRVIENMDEILANREKLALVILNPDLPWKCVIFTKLYTIVSSLLIIAIGFSMVYMTQRGYKFYLKQCKSYNDQIYSMVEKIIDILQSNIAENSDNFLAVNHVRDMIIAPQDRKSMAPVWNRAVKFLEENESRVRTEVQIVSGEEFHVWRWVGSPSLNISGSPRSKIWQGQAFETQVGSVNSLPCSPTPCLKVRGMFDERERNHFTIREAVLNKCASHCKILHCEVDLNTKCVYLKCANQNDAAIAYRNLHGWWYDGHLLTVKYLRLERYMQRFPDSPVKGPPFLQPTSNTSVTNDWSNNDD